MTSASEMPNEHLHSGTMDSSRLAEFLSELLRPLDAANKLEAETKSYGWLVAKAKESGLSVFFDKLMNLHVAPETTDRSRSKSILIGCHIDTVPMKGYGGSALGAAAGIEVLMTLASERLNVHLELVVFNDSECVDGFRLGSRGFCGQLQDEELQKVKPKGVDPSIPVIDICMNDYRDVVYFEVYPEQGPQLWLEQVAVGFVNSMAGQRVRKLKVVGETGHAGATPMKSRRDPVMGISVFHSRALDIVTKNGDENATVLNVCHIAVDANMFYTIPSEASFELDVRDTDVDRLNHIENLLLDVLEVTMKEFGLQVVTESSHSIDPANCCPLLNGMFHAAARSLEIAYSSICTAAIHDAVICGKRCPVGMLLVPSTLGKGDGDMNSFTAEHAQAAVSLLTEVIRTLNEGDVASPVAAGEDSTSIGSNTGKLLHSVSESLKYDSVGRQAAAARASVTPHSISQDSHRIRELLYTDLVAGDPHRAAYRRRFIEAETVIESLRKRRAALLCIDMQFCDAEKDTGLWSNEFIAGTARSDALEYYFSTLNKIVLPNVRRVQEAFRQRGLEVIHTRIQSATIDGRDRSQGHKLLCVHSPPGSLNAAFLPEIAPRGDEIVLNKTASGVFGSTNIEYILRNLDIDTLYVVGVFTNECVSTAVRNAADKGFVTTVLEDCCTAATSQLHESAILELRDRYARIVETATVINEVEQAFSLQ